jgi:hypothetical protein
MLNLLFGEMLFAQGSFLLHFFDFSPSGQNHLLVKAPSILIETVVEILGDLTAIFNPRLLILRYFVQVEFEDFRYRKRIFSTELKLVSFGN